MAGSHAPIPGLQTTHARTFESGNFADFPRTAGKIGYSVAFFNTSALAPEKIKQIESLEIILQMTALKRGVCVLPEWLADIKNKDLSLKKIPIGKKGFLQKLYLALRKPDKGIPYIQKFIAVGQKTAKNSVA